MTGSDPRPMTLKAVLTLIRRNRLAIVLIMAISIGTATVLAFVLPPTYRGTVLLAPSRNTDDQDLLSKTGGALGLLSGLRPAQGNSTMEALAVLRSRQFLERFIQGHNLMQVLYADRWDAASGKWKQDEPSLEDGYLRFRQDVLSVQVDEETGFVKLQVDGRSSQVAANWANELVKDLNKEVRERVVAEATADLKFLNARMREAAETELRTSISNLIRDRMKEIMLAMNRENYVFRVLEAAAPSRYRTYPRIAILIGAGFIVGFLLCLAWVSGREALTAAE